MTSIAWSNGPIFRNGAVGTEQACCCEQFCCFTDINCDIVVTVTYSNGQTRTNGDFQLNHLGNDMTLAPVIGYSVSNCNVVTFAHDQIAWIGEGQLFECYQVAVKQQKINCATCCEDGTACDCVIGSVVHENYSPVGGFGDCSDAPTTVHVTGISITLANCGDCPCEFP